MPEPTPASPGGALQLRDFWYIAATSRELGRRPLARTVLGIPVALFRDGAGRAAAVEDRCAHRNMPLSAGRVEGGCLECPYHGWRYAGSGECVEIPSLRHGETPPAGTSVRAYPTVEQDGFVWVYPGDGTPAGPPRRFPHHGEPGWTSFLMRSRFRTGALACLENFLDCPHTVYVHQGWFRSRNTREVRARVTRTADELCVAFHEERDAESLVSRLFFPSGEKMVHTDRFLMPTTSRVDYRFGPERHFIITSQCTPVTEQETAVYTMMTYRFGRLGGLVRGLLEPVSRRILRQDLDALALQGEQVRRFGGPRFTFVQTDLVGPHIWALWQRHLRQARGETVEPADLSDEVVLRF